MFAFDVVGKGQPHWGVTREQHEGFVKAFPGVDVMAQYQKAAVWLTANPTKRKTPRGMPRFLFAWMERQQNGSPRAQTLNGGPPIANGAHSNASLNLDVRRTDELLAKRRAAESAMQRPTMEQLRGIK